MQFIKIIQPSQFEANWSWIIFFHIGVNSLASSSQWLIQCFILFNLYLARVSPIEIGELFFKGDLTKNGSNKQFQKNV